MDTLRLIIEPRSAFGSPIRGDTLFGQLCWAIRNRFGNDRLEALLDGYTSGNPFTVCSDAFPHGFVPRPVLPTYRFRSVADADRKSVKKRRWVPVAILDRPVVDWLADCVTDEDVGGIPATADADPRWVLARPQQHNTIDRTIGTTGSGEFAPYTMPRTWYAPGVRLDAYLVFDPGRVSRDDILQAVDDIGRLGYGRDASIGLGKFEVIDAEPPAFAAGYDATACMTLSPCAPQGLGWNAEASYYTVFTRFGRHGDTAVMKPGGPFKTPVLLADTGALFAIEAAGDADFIGQGLGGSGRMSRAVPSTVQQGFAPVVRVKLERGSP